MQKVLIAEDDLMIADMTEECLVERGYEVCGIARTVAEAVALGLLHKPDLAVLDLRLADGRLGTEVAAQLKACRRLGILYATGTSTDGMLCAADGDACLGKPYTAGDLVRGLEIVSAIVANGPRLPPFPRRFQLLPPASTACGGSGHG